MTATASRHSPWRLFPAGVAVWLVMVAAVNGAMIAYALNTFPGEVGGNAFDISNHYDAVLQAAEVSARTGWDVTADADQRRAVVRVTGPGANRLTGALLHGVASRPLGPAERTVLAFSQMPSGEFLAVGALPSGGQWDLLLTVEQGGHRLHVTRRLVVR